MSAIVYNGPENMNLEVPLFSVKGGGRLARNVSVCLAQYVVSHPQTSSFHSHCHEITLKISYIFTIVKIPSIIQRGTSQVSNTIYSRNRKILMSHTLSAVPSYDTLPLPGVFAWSFVISALNFTIVSFASFTLSFRSLIS